MIQSAIHRTLGDAFLTLPREVQATHDNGGTLTLSGRADVVQRRGLLPRFICWMMGLPASGMGQPVTVAFTTDAKGVDRWVRNFNGRIYKSVLWAEEPSRSHLLERMGLLTTRFALAAKPDRLTFDIVGMSLLGVPLPRWIRPRCHAFETGQARAFAFDITIEMPPFGRLIHYRGVLSQVVPSQGETLPAHTTSRL